jgi:excisionase family DNA binding protein
VVIRVDPKGCTETLRSQPSNVNGFGQRLRGNVAWPTAKPNQTLAFRDRLGCSPSEACAAVGVGRTTLYRLIAEGQVDVTKIGRRTVVSVRSLVKLLDSQTAEPKPSRPGRPRKPGGVAT